MTDRLTAALEYVARGWRVFPLRGKLPLKGSHGFKDATCDVDRVRELWAGRALNIGLACGAGPGGRAFVVLDPDGPEGMETLQRLARECGPLPRTLTCQTARGLHLYYWASMGLGSVGKLDFQGEGGYVILPPSVHPSGAVYRWVVEAEIADLPAAHREWLEANRTVRGGKANKSPKNMKPITFPAYLLQLSNNGGRLADRALAGMEELPPIGDVIAALEVIQNDDLPWGDWNTVGMRVWAATGGAEAGREAWRCWSRQSRKHTDAEIERRWAHWSTSPPTATGMGALVVDARRFEPGWTPPSRAPREAFREEVVQHSGQLSEPHNATPAGTNGHASVMATLPAVFSEPGGGDSKNLLIKLNKQYCVIGDIGGKCMVMGWTRSKVDQDLKVPSFQTFKSFQERYANQYVTIKSMNKKEELVEEAKQIGAHWLKWPGRISYEGIDLDPKGEKVLPGNVLNLWSGFSVEPAAGSWERMQRHILDVLACGDVEAARYIYRFAAWAIQNPGRPAEVALVLRGGKGSGKGVFANAIRRLFGQHGLQIYNSKHLVGNFNGHLKNCLLLFADEAFWAGDKQGESALKGLITESVLAIEHKGLDAIQWKNRLHVIMAANAEWVVPASHDERRYCVFNVSNHRAQDRTYFKALIEEMESGGLAAMLHDLLHADLSGWHPREIVHNEALRGQKERSLDGRHAWLEHVLQDGVLPCMQGATNVIKNEASARDLLDDARPYGNRFGEVNATNLGRMLREWKVMGLHRNNGKYWVFDQLNVLRKRWEEKFGKWAWDVDRPDWA